MKIILLTFLFFLLSTFTYAGNWCSDGYLYLNDSLVKRYDYQSLQNIEGDLQALELYEGDTVIVFHSNYLYYGQANFVGEENGSDSLINAFILNSSVSFFGNGDFNMHTVNGCFNIYLNLKLEFKKHVEELEPIESIDNTDLFYPNPASNNESLFFDTNCEFGGTYSVLGLGGDVLFSKEFSHGRNVINISSLKPGIYIFLFSYIDKIETKKLVINNY